MTIVFSTPWFNLEEELVTIDGEVHKYYSLDSEAVIIIAEDDESNIMFVKQYRPIIKKQVIELPRGLVEGSIPEEIARVELLEETGYIANRMDFFGEIAIDSGRSRGYLYCYHATGLQYVSEPEKGIVLVPLQISEFKKMILGEEFKHSLCMSVLFLADLKGLLK